LVIVDALKRLNMAVKKAQKNDSFQLIKKSNHLIEARYKFDIWEQRIFIALLSGIRMEDEDFKTYRISYKDVIKTFGLKSGQSYGFLRDAARGLMRKVFKVSSMESGFRRETEYHIVRSVNYLSDTEKGRGVEQQHFIDITFDPQMKPLLLQLQKNFTAYDPRNITKLGVFGLRIYELLKQYETLKTRTLVIEDMKKMFEIEEEYPLFANFFQKVITPSVRDINKFTDLTITNLEKIKEGKKVVALKFNFQSKSSQAIQALHTDIPTEQLMATPIASVSEADNTEIFDQFYPIVGGFWGINPAEFRKRLVNKTAADVQIAIEFTQEVIRNGAAKNPSGLFLNALSEGHKSKIQVKQAVATEKQHIQATMQAAITTQIQALYKKFDDLENDYLKELNDGIRTITENDPAVAVAVMENLKAKYADNRFADKTMEDFRHEPVLRGLLKQEIILAFPQYFEAIHQVYRPNLENLKAQIWQLDPYFKFE
jgi:plasmid replication initiation protein